MSCAILARPTKSEALYLQQVGRVLRTFEGKPDALILDHAGNTMQHGLPDEQRAWSLDAKKRRKKREADRLLSVRLCKGCFFAYPSKEAKCPACGAVPEKKDLTPDQIAGELQEITPTSRTWRQLYIEEVEAAAIAELRRRALANNYSPGWVSHQMRALNLTGGAHAR